MALKANEPPSVGGTTVPPATVLPLSSTFHIATVRAAAPFPFASGRACMLNVQVPAAKLRLPGASTIQPAQDDGIEGVEELAAVLASVVASVVPTANGAHPVTPRPSRLSACGITAP